MTSVFIGHYKDQDGIAEVWQRSTRFAPDGKPVPNGLFDVRFGDGSFAVFDKLPRDLTSA